MKALKYTFSLCLALLFFWNCADDDNLDYLDKVVAPTNVSAVFQVAQDNSGLVKIIPNADGAVSYNILYGDETAEAVAVDQGKDTEHIYAEGTYTVSIEAVGITGLKSTATLELPVFFKPPENLVITAVINDSNPFQLDVSATADYAASFNVCVF